MALVRRSFRIDGGAEYAISSFVSAYQSIGCKVILICEDWNGDPQIFDEIVRIPAVGLTRLAKLKSFTKRVEAWITQNPAVVVQSHEWTAGAQILRLGDGLHSEWLRNQQHGMSSIQRFLRKLSGFHRYRLAQEVLSLSDKRTNIVIVNSLFIQKSLIESYSGLNEKVVVVRNSCRQRSGLFSLPISLPVKGGFVVGFLGSGWARKGLKPIIEALSLLGSDYRLVVGGKDKYEAKYKALAERLNVEERVSWLGLVEDLEQFYSEIDCLVLPSRYDPFPNVVTEAMTAGVPVVSSPHTGAVDYMHLKGVAIAEVDRPNDIALQINKMRSLGLDDLALLKTAASDFDEKHVRRQVKEILDRVVGEDITY